MKLKYDVKVNAAKNIGILCSVTLLSVLAASCGKSSTTNSAAPGGGEPTPPPPTPGTANNLTPQAPSAAACGSNFCILGEVAKQKVSLPVTFKLDTATADQLVVSITPKTGSAKEWTTSCPTSTITSSITCTVTYTPTTSVPEGKNTATLSYTYRNNLSKTVAASTTLPLSYEAATVFSSKKLATAINFADYSQMNFSNSVPIFGLAGAKLYNNLANTPTQILPSSTFTNFDLVPKSLTQLVLKNTDSSKDNPDISIYDTVAATSTPLTGLTSYAMDSSQIYGGTQDGSGNIYSINSTFAQTLLGTIPNLNARKTQYTFTDNSSPILYSISTDSSYSEYLCSTSTTTPALNCITTNINQAAAFYQNQIASNGTVYIQTASAKGTQNQIQAYTTASSSPVFTVSLNNSKGIVPMTYDSTNKILYAVIPTTTGSYNLAAYNATNGALLWASPAFTSLSKPFLTSGNTAVLLVAPDGIYGFMNSTTLAPAFASGYSLPFSQNSTPASLLVTTDSSLSNTMDIPATLTDGITPIIYSINMNW